MINVWTKYNEPMLYSKGETDLITTSWHCGLRWRKCNTYVLPLGTFVTGETKTREWNFWLHFYFFYW